MGPCCSKIEKDNYANDRRFSIEPVGLLGEEMQRLGLFLRTTVRTTARRTTAMTRRTTAMMRRRTSTARQRRSGPAPAPTSMAILGAGASAHIQLSAVTLKMF